MVPLSPGLEMFILMFLGQIIYIFLKINKYRKTIKPDYWIKDYVNNFKVELITNPIILIVFWYIFMVAGIPDFVNPDVTKSVLSRATTLFLYFFTGVGLNTLFNNLWAWFIRRFGLKNNNEEINISEAKDGGLDKQR